MSFRAWLQAKKPVNTEGEMTLVEHLTELRYRLIVSLSVVLVLFILGFIWNQQIADFLLAPYCQLPAQLRTASTMFDDQQCRLIFTDVFGGFMVRMKSALVVAILFGAPFCFYQLWAFIVPGLQSREKRWAIPYIILSHLLFFAGAAFAYFLIPLGLDVILQFGGQEYVSLLDAQRYLTFVIQVTVAFGLSFEYPLLLSILVLMGVLNRSQLTTYRRHAIFLSFVASAVITPTQDPITMILMAVPLVLFYEAVVLFAWFRERATKAKT